MWELSHSCLDLACKHGTLESIAEKARDVSDTRTTERTSGFQKRKTNEGPYCRC